MLISSASIANTLFYIGEDTHKELIKRMGRPEDFGEDTTAEKNASVLDFSAKNASKGTQFGPASIKDTKTDNVSKIERVDKRAD